MRAEAEIGEADGGELPAQMLLQLVFGDRRTCRAPRGTAGIAGEVLLAEFAASMCSTSAGAGCG